MLKEFLSVSSAVIVLTAVPVAGAYAYSVGMGNGNGNGNVGSFNGNFNNGNNNGNNNVGTFNGNGNLGNGMGNGNVGHGMGNGPTAGTMGAATGSLSAVPGGASFGQADDLTSNAELQTVINNINQLAPEIQQQILKPVTPDKKRQQETVLPEAKKGFVPLLKR